MIQDRLTIVYATDERFWVHTLVSLYSLLVNNRDLRLDIRILTRRPIQRFPRDCEFLRTSHPDANVSCLLVSDDLFADAPTTHITIESYYRLMIASLLPETTGRILYIDGDTIVRRSLGEFFSLDLEGNVVGAIHQPDQPGIVPHIERLGLAERSVYFNAGVLLIDLEEWRSRGIESECLTYVQTHTHDSERLKFHDQDTLNVVLAQGWKRLDPTYNFSDWTLCPGRPISIRRGYHPDPHIVHFAGPIKPWHGGSLHPFETDYWTYRSATPYSDRRLRMRAIAAGLPRRLRSKSVNTVRELPWGESFLSAARSVRDRFKRRDESRVVTS